MGTVRLPSLASCTLLSPIAPADHYSLKSNVGEGFRSGSRGLRLMSNWAYGFCVVPDGFWRRLVAVVLVHAVAVQALLIVLGGFSLAANADQNSPAFELCSHDANGATSPAKLPDHSGFTHCTFCFAGAHHAVIGTASSPFHRVNLAMVVVPWLGDSSSPRRLTRYTIASPRGPPLDA
jgi:Protein of unknown function (DUF2946)